MLQYVNFEGGKYNKHKNYILYFLILSSYKQTLKT